MVLSEKTKNARGEGGGGEGGEGEGGNSDIIMTEVLVVNCTFLGSKFVD